MTDQATDRATNGSATSADVDAADGAHPDGTARDGAQDADRPAAAADVAAEHADHADHADHAAPDAGRVRTAGTTATAATAGTAETAGTAGSTGSTGTAGTAETAGTAGSTGSTGSTGTAETVGATEATEATETTEATGVAEDRERDGGGERRAGGRRRRGRASDDGAALATDAPAVSLVGPDGRDPHLDNVKFLAIVLVVAGHAWGPMLAWSHALQGVYLFLYTVHMPIFVTLSGYFSRHFTASPRQARGLVRAVVVPYLIVETAFTLFRYFADGQKLDLQLQDPWWVTWFLMTLFFWRLSAPLWRVVRFPLVIGVVTMLAAGSTELTGTFELGRLLQYLPFFVLGLSLRQEHFAKLRTTWARVLAVPVLAGALYGAYVLAPHASVEWVYWRHGYEYFDVPYPAFAAIKLMQLAATLVVIAAAIALVPARRIPVVTAFGAASMYAYLLHGFVTKGAEYGDVYDMPFLHSHLGIAVVGLASIVLTLVLCSPPVRVLFSWAIQPRLEGWLRGGSPRV